MLKTMQMVMMIGAKNKEEWVIVLGLGVCYYWGGKRVLPPMDDLALA